MDLTEEQKDEINKKRKDNWIEAWFGIEVLAVKEDVAKASLEQHIEKLSKVIPSLRIFIWGVLLTTGVNPMMRLRN